MEATNVTENMYYLCFWTPTHIILWSFIREIPVKRRVSFKTLMIITQEKSL